MRVRLRSETGTCHVTCGDVNPIYSVKQKLFGKKLGGEILRCLGQLEPVAKPALRLECRELQMPARERPELKEAEIALKWPEQVDHYKAAFNPNSEAGVDGIAQRLDAQGFAPTKAVLICNTAEEAQSPERQSPAARPPLQLRSSGLRT